VASTTVEPSKKPHPGGRCPLVCGALALVRRLAARCPHATRAAALLAGAVLLAVTFNAAAPLGLPWLPSPPGRVGIPRAYASRLPEINAAHALSLYRSGEALFVDSRDREDYEEDHIPGAMNFPMRRWAELWPEMQSRLPRDSAFVLYCYGAHCGLSTRQGKMLLQNDYDDLLVLDYGWKAWREAGYPTVRDLESAAD